MLTLVLLQQKEPLAENWKQLQQAWHEATHAKGDEDYVADEVLAAAAKVHAAFEACGLNARELAADRAALKRALKARLVPAVRTKLPTPKAAEETGRRERDLAEILKLLEKEMGQGSGTAERFAEALSTLAGEAPLALRSKDAERAAHETKVTGALEALGVIDKDAAPWLRRRVTRLVIALHPGGEFPAVPALTPRLKEQIAALIEQLGDADIARRDEACAQLLEIGEATLPQLQEAARSDDGEVRARARRILGIKD